ncbi:MAG: hypothetical protein ACYC26_04540 [Phycisphaerales bacterium]
MGTFHDNLGELHGLTIALQTRDGTVYVGRCHEVNEHVIVMHDADHHRDGEGGMNTAEYLKNAGRWGVFKKHDHLVLECTKVAWIKPLNQF